MDRGDTGMGSGTGKDVPFCPILFMVHSNRMDSGSTDRYEEWYRLGCSHSVTSVPWCRWTVEMRADALVHTGM